MYNPIPYLHTDVSHTNHTAEVCINTFFKTIIICVIWDQIFTNESSYKFCLLDGHAWLYNMLTAFEQRIDWFLANTWFKLWTLNRTWKCNYNHEFKYWIVNSSVLITQNRIKQWWFEKWSKIWSVFLRTVPTSRTFSPPFPHIKCFFVVEKVHWLGGVLSIITWKDFLFPLNLKSIKALPIVQLGVLSDRFFWNMQPAYRSYS